MALNIMQKIKPVGTFPAVDAEDVLMPDGTRLSEKTFTPGESTSQHAVLYTSQTLTEAQKLQARQNIDAASATDMENEIDRLDERISNIGTGGGSITVDAALNPSSTNPVQNKVICEQLAQANTVLGQLQASIPTESAINALIDAKFVPMTQSEYDALTDVDPNKYYMIVGDSV